MKRRLSLLLFIIPLLVIPFVKVDAENKETKVIKEITKKQVHSQFKIKFDGANNQEIHHGSLYEIELDNTVALCLDPNKPINYRAKYKMVGKIMNDGSQSSTLLIKAYLYALSNPSVSGYEGIRRRAAAQIVAWQWGNAEYTAGFDPNELAIIQKAGNISLDSNYYMIYNEDNFKKKYPKGTLERSFYDGLEKTLSTTPVNDAAKHFLKAFYSLNEKKKILETEIPSDLEYLGIWQDINTPKNQRVLALPDEDAEEKLAQENCKQVTFNALMPCYGDGSYTLGSVYQTTVGQCLPGYNRKQNNAYSTLGKKELDVGTYCRMYCNKHFYENLPGNISKTVNVGRYIVWPNNNINNNRYKVNANLSEYPMSLAIEKSCYLSPDAGKLGEDYTMVLANYNNYIRSISSIYNRYRADGRVCTWFQNDYNTKKADADYKCSIVGTDPGCTNHHHSETCSNDGGKTVFDCSYTTCDDNPGRAEYYARRDACNSARDAESEALTKLNQCNNIQNYVNAVVNVVNDFNNCVTYNASFNLNFSAPGASASYDDDEYGTSMQLKETKTVKTCDGCNSGLRRIFVDKNNVEVNLITNKTLTNTVKAINGRKISAKTLKYYDLTDGHYLYVNKDNNKSVNSNSGLKNYSVIGFSNMPISYKANPKKNYNLKISIPTLTGMASDFAALVSSNNYVCHYKVTKTTTSSCVCPEGTKHAGESLDCLSKNNDGTCVELQEQYCNSDQEIPHNCTENDLTCPNDPTMNLSSCVNAGKTYSWCVNNFCNSNYGGDKPGNQKWVCPAGTNEGMDLSSCVIPMIIKGYSEKDAYNYCKDVTCPYGGIKIIYRVIDLTNPFPSKDADSIVTQRDLRVGMFNDELRGRYPGSNWNSTTVVKNRILNNRNVDGDKVYNKKPLYEFRLNSSMIRAIRDYNKKQRDSYADFSLNCLDGRSACVSSFVHSSISGITGGTCRNVTKNSFYTCHN